MSNKKSKNFSSKYTKNSKHINYYVLIPIIFIISILPFVMKYHDYNTGLSQFNWFSSDDAYYDIYLYYKQFYFIIATAIMFITLIAYMVYNKNYVIFKNINFIPLFIYMLLAVLSTIASKYSSISLKGMFEQFESLFVLLGYSIIVFYCITFIKSSQHVTKIFKYLNYSIIVFSILGLTQILGKDFFSTSFGKKLFVPSIYWNQLEKFNLTFENNRVYLSLYNPNYVGVFTSLLIPIYISLLILVKDKKKRIINFICLTGLVICLIGSKSKAGIIGLLVSCLFMIIFYRRHIFKINKVNIAFLLVLLLTVGLFSYKNISTILNILTPNKTSFPLSDITTTDKIGITYNNNTVYIDYTYSETGDLVLSITDDKQQNLSYNIDSATNEFIIDDSRFENITIKPIIYDDKVVQQITIDNKEWLFTKLEDNTFYYINKFGKYDKIITADSAIFNGYESFASGRGYIWSRSIPLLKDNILLGSGPDTYAAVFPQQDYVNLYNNGFGNQVLTKPHSLYLQIGIQTGVLSLIMFLLFYLVYFFSSFKLYFNNKYDNDLSIYGSAIFIATTSYMITGISNDSSLAVSPIFWALIGIGIAINYLSKDRLIEKQ